MSHQERLTAPIAWWLTAAGLAATIGWLMYVATTPMIAAVCFIVAAVFFLSLVAAWGAIQIRVDDELRVGRAHIGPEFIGEVEEFTASAYRDALGPGGDVRAWLGTRPWLHTGVRVMINDPHDPHPYWLIGTRHPHHLSEAISALRDHQSSKQQNHQPEGSPRGQAT